jgi:hypothetical protein
MIRCVIQCVRYSGDWVTLLKLRIPKMMLCENCHVWSVWIGKKRPTDIFILLKTYHLKYNQKSDWVCVFCNFITHKTPDGTSPAMQDNTNIRNLQSAEKRTFKGPSLGKNKDIHCSITGYKQITQILNTNKYLNAICNGSLWTVGTV